MAYRTPKVPYSIGWKLKFETYTDGKRLNQDIPKTQWASLGFHVSMNWEQAKERAAQLNAQEKLKRDQVVINKIAKRLDTEKDKFTAYLPLVQEFEQEADLQKRSKWVSHWRAAQRIILELRLDTSDWAAQSNQFYMLFTKNGWSPSYVQKILFILNEYGLFVSRRYKKYFEPINAPKGAHKHRIANSYFDKSGGGHDSLPITPSSLESLKGKVKDMAYSWLYLSVWLGLRPHEVDQLLKPSSKRTWYTTVYNGHTIVWVYQTKLELSVSAEKRLKPIPLLCAQQKLCLTIIESRRFKRPSYKLVHSHFGPKTTLYGGRKGFVDLMMSLGHSLEKISQWMGHQDINRTWKQYKDRNKVLI